MTLAARLQWLFLANTVVLVTHQIDAAYWQEWELFRIPGGNQVNLLLNLPIIALVLMAYREVVRDGPLTRRAHQMLAGLGILTCALHSLFFALGHAQFLQPVSIGLMAATAVLSSAQLWLTARL